MDLTPYFFLVRSKNRASKGTSAALLRIRLPTIANAQRQKIVQELLERSGADASIEVFRSKGSIIRRDKREFSLILLYAHPNQIDWKFLDAGRSS